MGQSKKEQLFVTGHVHQTQHDLDLLTVLATLLHVLLGSAGHGH
jgi:hypothetical protein